MWLEHFCEPVSTDDRPAAGKGSRAAQQEALFSRIASSYVSLFSGVAASKSGAQDRVFHSDAYVTPDLVVLLVEVYTRFVLFSPRCAASIAPPSGGEKGIEACSSLFLSGEHCVLVCRNSRP